MPGSQLIRGLRLFDATTLIMGSMIGSGTFIVSADMARTLRSPGLYVLMAVLVMVDLLFVKPRFTWPGLILVRTGVLPLEKQAETPLLTICD